MINNSKSLQIEHLGWGTGRPASVDRDGLPQPYSDLGPDYSSYIFLIIQSA